MSAIENYVNQVLVWAFRKSLRTLRKRKVEDKSILQMVSSEFSNEALLKHSIAELISNESVSGKKIILQEVRSSISLENSLQYIFRNIDSEDELLFLSNVFFNEVPSDTVYKCLLPRIKAESSRIVGDEDNIKNSSNIDDMCKAWVKNSPDIDVFYARIKPLLFEYTGIFSSQEGEDILLKRLMKMDYNNIGFYVDVGAFHPTRFSTTLHFYLKGWSGLNIDPTPTMKASFDNVRPRDVNIQAGVSNESSMMEYHMFKEPAFNTFSEENKEYALSRTEYDGSLSVQTYRLDDIFDKYLPDDTCIMFCTIDVEGLELEVIESNDWKKYRPNILLIENIDDVKSVQTVEERVVKEGYLRVAQTKNTVFYMDIDYYNKVK